jgi:hypothetical protein
MFVLVPFGSGEEVTKLVKWVYFLTLLLTIGALLLIHYGYKVAYEFDFILYSAFLFSLVSIFISIMKLRTLQGTKELITIKRKVNKLRKRQIIS